MDFSHKATKKHKVEEFATKAQRQKEEMNNTKAIYYKIINLVTLRALVPSWQKTSLQKLCGKTFLS